MVQQINDSSAMKLVIDYMISEYLPVLMLFLCGFLGWASSHQMMQRRLQRLMPIRSPKLDKLEEDFGAPPAESADAEELKGPSSPAARRWPRRQPRKSGGAPAGADAEAAAEPAEPGAAGSAPAPAEPEARESQAVSDRVAKMMAKKAERKARKAQEQLECEAAAPDEPASLEERPECEAAAPDEPASLEERLECEAAAPDKPASLEEPAPGPLQAPEWADLEDEEGEWVRPPPLVSPVGLARAWGCEAMQPPTAAPVEQGSQPGGLPAGACRRGGWGDHWAGSPSSWKESRDGTCTWGNWAAQSPSQGLHAEPDSWMVPFGELRSPGAGAWVPARSMVPPAPQNLGAEQCQKLTAAKNVGVDATRSLFKEVHEVLGVSKDAYNNAPALRKAPAPGGAALGCLLAYGSDDSDEEADEASDSGASTELSVGAEALLRALGCIGPGDSLAGVEHHGHDPEGFHPLR